MDPVFLATALAGALMSSAQMAIASMMVPMNADNAAQRNIAILANVAAGVGQNLNITV